MNFANIKKKLSGTQPSADPSRAFGSEAEMMEALRRQEFTPPKPRPSAAEVVETLRQRFTRPAPQTEREDIARTYAPEAMAQPEWENPFTAPEKPKRPTRDVPVYETVGGDMPFPTRAAVPHAPRGYDPYSGYPAPHAPAGYEPFAPAPPYPPQGHAAAAYAPPYYDPYSAAPMYAPAGYEPYDPAAFYPPYPPQGFAPVQETAYAPPPGYAVPEQDTAFYGEGAPAPGDHAEPPYTGAPYPPAAPAGPKRKPLEGADLRYVLWSGSIVSGVVLTIAAFVYACTL